MHSSPCFTTPLLSVLVMTALSMAKSPAQTRIYDHFDGKTLALSHWKDHSGSNVQYTLANSLLHFIDPAPNSYCHLVSSRAFSGDFEFILDWRNFRSTATSFYKTSPGISLQVTSGIHGGNYFVYISRTHGWNGHSFGSSGKLNGVWQAGVGAPAAATAGRLRITRTGTTIATAYDQGGGWKTLKTFAPGFGEIVTVQVGSSTGDNGSFRVDSDYLSYKGRFILAPVTYGAFCHHLQCDFESWPLLGSKNFAVGVNGAPPLAPLFLILGASNRTWGGLTLPFSLTPVGAPGCYLHASIHVLQGGHTADNQGEHMTRLFIPSTVSLLGQTMYCQWIVSHPTANPLGLAFSEALTIAIQR